LEAVGAGLDTQLSVIAGRLSAGSRLVARNWFSRQASIGPSSTNQDTHDLPFQRWYRFKEAFAPRAVIEAFSELSCMPMSCIDPFGGSGTTALTAQFLDVRPTTIEVNPFLADLIEAKLTSYDPDAVIASYRRVMDTSPKATIDPAAELAGAPPTFVEPGVAGRWIYDIEVAARILAFRKAIDGLDNPAHARLLRILLGSTLVALSNVIISGKGRRYRSGWQKRDVQVAEVGRRFEAAFLDALEDIIRYGRRRCTDYTLLRGDARSALADAPPAEFALFSPPYLNSFDYTDIYNVELWMLGYLKSPADNRALREATLRSHVQIQRSYAVGAALSPLLRATVAQLEEHRNQLWDREIPDMVRAYFDDLGIVLACLHRLMPSRASVMMVVGNSRYAGVSIDVGAIVAEVAGELGFGLIKHSTMRSMRASAQQGRTELAETLVHLTRE
jgi:hypothetical protein